jgi:hypothetical protein
MSNNTHNTTSHITTSRTPLNNILANAIVYADYVAGNHSCQVVRQGARDFSAECEQQLAKLQQMRL